MIGRLRFDTWQEQREIFSAALTFCADTDSVSIPPSRLLQWHVKDLGHSAKSADAMLQLYIQTFLTQGSRSGLTMLSRHNLGTYKENELTRNSSGNTRPLLSQLAEPLRTDYGLKGGSGARVLIST